MGSMQLMVLGFVFACISFSETRFLSMKGPNYWGVKGQRPAQVEPRSGAEPEREHSRESAQQAGRLRTKQRQQAGKMPLSWKFPEHPVDPVNKPPFRFEPRQPVAAKPVSLRCGESKIYVEVNQDLLGIGNLIKPEDIALGGCSATEIDDLSHVLSFESELHGCGSKLMMTDTAFIYAFTLVYKPKVLGKSNILRQQSAVIGVECRYPRLTQVHLKRPS